MRFDENFQLMVQDYFRIEQQRHSDIMATMQDFITQSATMNSKLDEKIAAIAAAVATHNGEIKKALSVLADVGASGHAAVLDQIIAAGNGTITKIESINAAETMGTMTSELVAAISAVPVPKP